MDKKNVDTSMEKPFFFEIFKAQCSESDLGPISFNWFEELSSEAPLYDFENPEDPEYTTSFVDQRTFKTPKRKLPSNSELASTPMIFKEQNKTLPLFVSPLKEVDQSKGEASRCHHPMVSIDTLDQSDEVVNSPFKTCLFASPPGLRKRFKTPSSNKCVLSESLLRTPKLFEAPTQKCISESLGAETDPDMSWSSSLATPPTLSPTVIIARGNDTVSGTKRHDERITLIMHSLFSKYCKSPTKNSVSVQSTSGVEDLYSKLDSESANFEKPIDGSFDVSRFLSKSAVNQKPPEDEDMHETGTDSGISVCLASGKAFLRKVETIKPSQKKLFEVEHDELKENEEAIKDSEEFSITEYERELNNKCNLQRVIIHNNGTQTYSENQNAILIEKEMPSLLFPWSQLDLSGLEITQLEKVSSCCGGSSSYVEKHSEDRASSSQKLPVPENAPIPVKIIRKKSSIPVKVCKDERASVENTSASGSLVIENTTFTDASETPSNYFHKYSKENCKISSGLPIDNISTPVPSDNGDLTRSGSPTRNSISNLKRRPKKFIYTLTNTPLHQEEGTRQRDGAAAFHVPFCSPVVSKTASRNEGETEDTLSSNKHVIEEKQEVGSEENCTFPDTLQESLYNKPSTESHFTDPSIALQTVKKEEAVLLSNLKAANQEEEPCEQKFFVKDILEKDDGGKCANAANFSLLPQASQLKMENKQEVLEVATQHSLASGTQLAEPGYLTKKAPMLGIDGPTKFSALKKNVNSRQPGPLDLKENMQDKDSRWLESASSSKTQSFDGFKTASNKQIAVSNNNVRKGKLLFRDIEDQFLEDFPSKGIQNVSIQNVQENVENFSVVRNNVNKNKATNFSHVSDFQVNFRECNDTKSIFPEYANLVFQNVPQNLTASQEAEITELSNILEETGSQFDFTQFKEQRTMQYNNNLEVSGSINKSEISKMDINSQVWKDTNFDECIRTKVQQGNYLSPDTTEESKAQRQSRKEVTSINSLMGKWNKTHFSPSVSAPLQLRLSDLGDSSIMNTEMNLSDEIISKAPKAVNEMGDMLDTHETYFQSGLSERSNTHCWNNPRYKKGIDWHQRVKDINAEYMLKNNAIDSVTFVKESISKDVNFNKNNAVHISSTREVNLKIVQKYSLHMTGNQLSSVGNNHSILVSHHFVNCGETQCHYNLQGTLSDLTCLAEVTKTEKSSLNDAEEKENFNSNQIQETTNNSDTAYSLQCVHTGADGNMVAEKRKTLPLLAGSCIREGLDNMSSSSNEKAGISSRKGAITSVKKNIVLNQNKINRQEGPDIQKRKQTSAVGFYTASGKQVTVSNESLAKARHLSEQNLFPKMADAFRSLVKPDIQASTKEDKDEKITQVQDEFGEGTEKHWGKVLNPQSIFKDSLQTGKSDIKKDLSPETCAFESSLVSHGKGKEYKINEGLLAKNLTYESSKNDISKMIFIDSDMAQYCYVEEESGIYEKQDVHDFLIRNTSSVSHDACNERHSLSDNLIYISQEASSKIYNVEKNSSNLEDVLKNESNALQKCDLKLDANTLPKNAPSQTEASTSKLLKAQPVSFTTASGKTVGVSQDALTVTRQLLRSNCCKPVKQNTESQSETRKHDLLKTDVDNGRCAVSTNCLSVENTVVENSAESQFPRAREYCCGEEEALQYSGPMSLDLGPESSSQSSHFQMTAEHSNAWISNKHSGVRADFCTNSSGFFSTASGKPVKVSEESLKKSRLLFSEIENNSSDHQGSILHCSYDESSVRNKATPQKNKQLSQRKTSTNLEGNSNISCGFSTASGKQMQISEKALQKVMGLIKEFDDISGNCSGDEQDLRQGHISPIKPSATEAENEIVSKSKERCNAVYLSSNHNEKDIMSIETSVCVSRTEKYKQVADLEEYLPCAKEIKPLEMNQLNRDERKYATKCNTVTRGNLNFHCPYSEIHDNYLETEASESAKAFMEDDDLPGTEIQKNKKKFNLASGKTSNFLTNTRTGKRHMEVENTSGEPPIKRKLLPEFNQSERPDNSSFKVLKSTPDGMNDRRKFTYNISLKPVISGPSKRPLTEESKKKEDHPTVKRPVKVFVPPFKTKSGVSEDTVGNNKGSDLPASKSIDGKEEPNPAILVPKTTTELENELLEEDTVTQISVMNSNYEDEDLTKILAHLQHARNSQEIRILKKQRQRICPQPGSLYLMKVAAAAFRVPLKAAVEEKSPGSYSSEQLYSLGVTKQCMKVNSRNAEDFQFFTQEFFSKASFLERYGILLADGGYLIPTNEGKAGKEEFYQALCDTPGVDPKLISKAWVYNHYRWIIWKLAAMEVAFPQEFANKCLTPESVLLQLKYRYDVEVDRSHRSAIKRITERDDVAAKTLILCISKIIPLSANVSHIGDNKDMVEESRKKVAAVEVTDGWYAIQAILDPPLQSLLCKDKLSVGQKIIVHGAELVGSQDASTPLEAPESLKLKISANSTRRTRWYSKLGYHWDPRPFCVPLSSLFSDGGTISCIDVIVQRIYPIQWMEKVSVGSYVFRNCRAEEREAAKHAENRQKMLEALLAKIQAEFEKSDGESKRAVRSRTLTRQQIHSLQDGAELYEAVLNAADPAYMEGYFSKEQLKALNNHRQMVNEKRQAQIEAEFRKAVESAEQDEHASCKRDVIPVMKLRIMDYRKEGRRKEVILNIWRPSSHVCTLLKEGNRYKIFHLTASQSKDRSETANLQLTATKKTQYLQLPVSQEILSHLYKPRQPLQFSRLLEPSFRQTCSEVDLVGYIVCLRKGTGSSTLLYLSDENHNLIAIQICSDLKQLAIEDIVIPSTVISAINLLWRPEFRSCIPTLFAGDRSAFSSKPKESHLQGTFNELRNIVANDNCFGKDVQQRLMDLLQADSPQVFNLPKKCGLDPFPSPWKPGAGNKHSISTCCSELKHSSPMTLGKQDPKPLVSLGSTKLTQELQETPKNYNKRKAIELLSQVPSPPPVKPICTFVSPLVKRAFQPPRSSGAQCERLLERQECQSVKQPALKTASKTGITFENNFVADEELAMINTQSLLTSFPKEGGSADGMAYSGHSDLPDRLLLRNSSSQRSDRKNIMQDSSVGADLPKKDTNESHSSLAVQKSLQRQRKPKN